MGNLVTGKVRFSYVNVFEPRVTPNGDEKFSVTLLVPKSDTDTYNRINAEINRVMQESIANIFKGVMPTNPKLPIHDGDGLRQSGEPYGPECKGCWVITANSNAGPEVVDAGCNPIISRSEFYSGCYGRASLRFYAYNQNGNKGIGCGLGNVQKLEDGQPLDGRTTAAEDFGTPTQTASVQPQYQVPVQPQPPVVALYQTPMQQPVMPQYQGPVDPITGQPVVVAQTPVNNIYGVS